MRSILFAISFVLLSFFSCEKSETQGQTADRNALDKLRNQIEDMVKDIPCEDSSEWSFTALGDKPCGGPTDYLAYPSTIDQDEFLGLIERYNEEEKSYNKKYNIVSDCMGYLPPNGVACKDGKPVLTYKTLEPERQ